ncbi:MAG TPA: substrate-binding domain-containing protein [Solirubrobacteraceae bacterium]|jgi:ribose transport system substrate-binding protein
MQWSLKQSAERGAPPRLRRGLAIASAVGVAALTATGGASAASGSHKAGAAAAGPYKIVLSNNFLGNDFRPEMERVAKLTANLAPFKGKISLQIVNAQSTAQAQISSLNSIILTRPNAILVDDGAGPALNPVIQRACSEHILVVSFDNPVTAPCAYKVSQDMYHGQVVVGQWMDWALHNTGKIFVDRGLPGAPVSAQIQNGFMKGLSIGGGSVSVAGQYNGNYAPGPEQQGISQLLAGNKDVAGVMTQGYCKPAFKAFQNAGISKLPPTTCYGYNGELVACAKDHAKCAILTGSPEVVQIALKTALDALNGSAKPPTSKTIPVPMTLYTSSSAGFHPKQNPVNVKIDNIVLGKNAYPQLAPGLALPFSLPQYAITAKQAAGG